VRIIHSSPSTGFSIIPNAALQDTRLSIPAIGVLAQLLSRPAGWDTNADAMSEFARRNRGDRPGEGRRAMRTAFAELEEHGYLVRRKMRDAGGRFVTVLMLYDTPGHGATEDTLDTDLLDRGTAYGMSVDGTSVDGTSVSGTSLERTDIQRTDIQSTEDKDSPALADARAAAAAAREKRLERIYEVVDHLSDAVLKDALLKFERHRPQIYRECRQRALAQFERIDARILNRDQAALNVDNLSFKFGVLHYEEKGNWPGWMAKPLEEQYRRDQAAQAS
jgi:hypothetical protein